MDVADDESSISSQSLEEEEEWIDFETEPDEGEIQWLWVSAGACRLGEEAVIRQWFMKDNGMLAVLDIKIHIGFIVFFYIAYVTTSEIKVFYAKGFTAVKIFYSCQHLHKFTKPWNNLYGARHAICHKHL